MFWFYFAPFQSDSDVWYFTLVQYNHLSSNFDLSLLFLRMPGNDDRYVSNVRDVRYSVFESLIRSIGHRKLELHRKFPKTESLKVSIFYQEQGLFLNWNDGCATH